MRDDGGGSMRRVVAGAIGLAAAGAVAGVVVGTGHGVAWSGAGAALTAVTTLIATFWWERGHRKRSAGRVRPGPVTRVRVRQRVGSLDRGGRLAGAQGASSVREVDVRQRVDVAGADSVITGYDGDPGRTN